MKNLLHPILLGSLVALAPGAALAWDEDTCSEGSEPESAGTFPDPTCASPQPLLGSHPTVRWDHSTAHWEFTYAMARCVGVPDADAQKIAAADEGTDMSSPACGSSTVNQSTGGEFFLAGYACGYEVGSNGDAAQSAVPAYAAPLRWAHTDRCRSATRSGSLHGHGEFFHYPYWSTDGRTNNLAALEAWAFGGARALVDPADTSQGASGCDMSQLGAASGSAPACSMITVSNLNEYNTGRGGTPVCSGVAQADWRMPAPAPASGEDGDRALRLGIYLHALGDSYSHLTCQRYSGQTVSGASPLVPVSSTATDHADYATDAFCGSSPTSAHRRPAGVTYEMCVQACSLDAHSLEFGGADTLAYGDATALQALRDASVQGLRAVWDALARHAGRSARDNTYAQASAYRANIPVVFNGYYAASDRQSYARALFRPPSHVPEQPCMCPNGVYDWVPRSYDAATGAYGPGYCATLRSIAFSLSSTGASPITALSLRPGQSVKVYAVGTFARRDGTTETRVVSNESAWASGAAAVATVNDTQGASAIGTVAGVAAGSADVTATKLGVRATLRVTVAN